MEKGPAKRAETGGRKGLRPAGLWVSDAPASHNETNLTAHVTIDESGTNPWPGTTPCVKKTKVVCSDQVEEVPHLVSVKLARTPEPICTSKRQHVELKSPARRSTLRVGRVPKS